MQRTALALALFFAAAASALPDDSLHATAEAGQEAAETEKFHDVLGSPKQTHAKLAEALNAFDGLNPSQAADRAKGAAEQAAALEHEIARKAAGAQEIGLAKVMEAVNKQSADKRQHMFSILSEDYRKGSGSEYGSNDYYLRHQNAKLTVTTISGPIDRQDATFKFIPALCKPGEGACPKQNVGSNGCVSIESVNHQGQYIVQHEEGKISLDKGDGGDGFKAAATFCMKPGLANQESGVSFEPLGEPGNYMLHDGYHMKIGKVEGKSGTKVVPASATFRMRPGLFMGFCAGPAKTSSCTCLPGYLGESCALPCPGLDIKNGVTEVCNNNGDCVLDKQGAAACQCKEGFLGKECTLLCPRSKKNSKLCHGQGQCAVNEAFQPTCKCAKGHLGKDCSIACPGAGGDLGACSDHGQCSLDKSGKTASCKCNEDFKGADCFLACPKDKVGNVCSGHGQCSMAGADSTQCKCQDGWVGKACNQECPKSKNGDTCSGNGKCVLEEYEATCKCSGGFLGKDCGAKCPGFTTTKAGTTGCNGHGKCKFDEDTKTASCECHVNDGWLGAGCTKQCPRAKDDSGNAKAVCAGHGKCDLDKKGEAKCACDVLFSGAACAAECPTKAKNAVCTGHGKCQEPAGGVGTGKCSCAKDWLGAACHLTCPKGKDGNPCSGHGKCKVDGLRASCACDPQWSSADCGAPKCGTTQGFFDVKKSECKCPGDTEKCCGRDVAEKAALLDRLVQKEKALREGSLFANAEAREELMNNLGEIERRSQSMYAKREVFSMDL